MKRYLLDTSVYGVLVDKNEEDYELVKSIMKYAKKNREHFLTTLIIAKELLSERADEWIRDVLLPEYYSSISRETAPLEIIFSDDYQKAKKLAWSYIQKLEKKEVSSVMYDTLNYAWVSIARIDTFVTRNRRGILAKDYWKILKKSNRKMKLPFVKIKSPTEFCASLL